MKSRHKHTIGVFSFLLLATIQQKKVSAKMTCFCAVETVVLYALFVGNYENTTCMEVKIPHVS